MENENVNKIITTGMLLAKKERSFASSDGREVKYLDIKIGLSLNDEIYPVSYAVSLDRKDYFSDMHVGQDYILTFEVDWYKSKIKLVAYS